MGPIRFVCGVLVGAAVLTACSSSEAPPGPITRIDGPAVVDEGPDGLPDR